ncbi:hypothetical protein FSARC_9797 [Fusarium sarcochroum]|uniref:Uncharacterized protein n=1 Tax=Fusarium sarcochroum TaxID=1208366 RepID=A0A8H4TQK6_9HYPO|nr:hypothetical protein FSARC_9797 [Fusarium sarcochroum]
METGSTSAAMQLHPTAETYSPASRRLSRSSHPSHLSEATEASGPQHVDADIPVWLQNHMDAWRIPRTNLVGGTWMAEAFDYFDAGGYNFPDHLAGVRSQLRREWNKRKPTAPKATASRAKRPSDTVSNPPHVKRARNDTSLQSEGTPLVLMPPPPDPKPLGDLKGKYIIETAFDCCNDQTQRVHDQICGVFLSPGNGTSMRGSFEMGSLLFQYKALMFFGLRPLQTSSRKVWFRWRGKMVCGDFEEFRSDENWGWIKFLGDGEIEVWFDELDIQLNAKKGTSIGDARKYSAAWFWEEWHDLDDEDMDLLDRLDGDFDDSGFDDFFDI